MTVPTVSGLQYDASSLVPDLTDSLRMAFGVAQQRQEKARQEEAAGLGDQLTNSGTDALQNPETIKTLQRMARLDPKAAQFHIGLLQARDQKTHELAAEEAQKAVNIFTAFENTATKNPTEGNRFLASQIRELDAQGKDTSKLREMIGMTPDRQLLFAHRQRLLAGDSKLANEQGIDALIKATQYQNANLERMQRELDLRNGKQTDVAEMRKEFTNLSQPFIQMRDAHQRVLAASGRDSAAGDLALVFNYMKVLDPGSAVRESEQADARNAAGVPDQFRNLYNRVLTGERLTPAQRADFVSTSGSLFTRQKAQQDRLSEKYRGIASKRGLPADDVVVDLNAPEEAAPAQPAPGGAREGQTATNKTTGERIVFRAGQWVPLTTGGASGQY